MHVKAALLWIANLAYDLFCAAVNLSDVASDAIICLQFYNADQMEFFWISIAIFAIAQICFAVLFTVLYGAKSRESDGETLRALVLCFLIILPFGQLVPLIIWIGSFKFVWFDTLCEKLGLEVRNDVQNETSESDDPLSNYISKKLVMHGGFIIESIVESVPQSILQMVAIVIYSQVSVISAISLVISIGSVASRGLMVSFSIHRPTFVFNFACFVCDVFRVFCVVSWLFFSNPSSSFSEKIFFLSSPVDDIFTFIWWWKEVVVVCMAFLGGLLGLFSVLELFLKDHKAERARGVWKSTLGDLCLILSVTLFCLILFFPALIVLEAMILSALPVIVFKSLSSDQADYAQGYLQLFNWIQQDDYYGRLRHVNQFYARRFLEQSGHREVNGWAHPRPAMNDTPQYLKAVKIMQLSDEQFSLAETRRKEGWAVTRAVGAFMRAVCKQARKKWNQDEGCAALGILYFCWLCIPTLFLSAFCSLIYPIMSFYSVQWVDLGLLQQSFTMITFALMFFLLLLSYPVYRFYRCSSSVEFFHSYPRPTDPANIEASYKARFARRQRENTGRMCVLLANYCANEKNLLENHIVAVLPEITKFAGFSNAFAINVDKFLDSKTFYAMARDGLAPPSFTLSIIGGGAMEEKKQGESNVHSSLETKEEARNDDNNSRANDEDSQLAGEDNQTLTLPVASSSGIELVRAGSKSKSKSRSGSELLTEAMRSVGLDPQKILEVASVPSTLLHNVNSQYHEEMEYALWQGAAPVSASYGGGEEEELVVSLDQAQPDDHGHFSTSVFRQKSWQQHLAPQPLAVRRPRHNSAVLALPTGTPAFARFHTA